LDKENRVVFKKAMCGLAATVLVACTSTTTAPIVSIGGGSSGGTPTVAPPGHYIVKQGDNLFRIALEHGEAYRDLAAWNNLADANDIKVGQMLRLSAPGGATTTGINTTSTVTTTAPGTTKPAATTTTTKPATAATAATPTTGDDAIKWAWPAKGNILANFAKNGKGIDIGGKKGDPIYAAADGSIAYAGAGLRGYGQMIIIKHNKTYLTAYAHNNTILVKESENVKKGQKIAEMGSSDAESVRLHFEIRRFGKPVDPLKFLSENHG
jgi:lipoprotein NlpD